MDVTQVEQHPDSAPASRPQRKRQVQRTRITDAGAFNGGRKATGYKGNAPPARALCSMWPYATLKWVSARFKVVEQ